MSKSKEVSFSYFTIIETTKSPSDGLSAIEKVYYERKITKRERMKDTVIDRKWGFINEKGDIVVPLIYDCVWRFSEGISKVCIGSKWGLINKVGYEIIPVKNSMIYNINNGLFQVQNNGKWGIVDSCAHTIIDCKWDWVYPPVDGKFKVRKGTDYKFIEYP